ncbi:MAG: DUF2344 domain-containing protein [Clostridia bacterium]|nr:DUF2344 domain-containing protein [Clostridia bacterium]
MIVLKYEKTGRARFISHIDLLKHTERTIRRAEIPVKFSGGYSPHALLFFSAPLALGVSSCAEYLSIDTDMAGEEVLARYNASCAEGLKASRFFVCQKNPNLQGKVVSSDYVFDVGFANIDLSNGFEIEYKKKGEVVKEDVADKIFGVFEQDGQLVLRLATGNTNLRPDRLVDALNAKLGAQINPTDIVKIRQFVKVEDALVDVDEALKSL